MRIAGVLALILALPRVHAADVTGTWSGSYQSQGSTLQLTFHFAGSAAAVTGNVEGLPTSPAEIHDGRLDGDTLTFWVNSDLQGQPAKLLFKGHVSRDGSQIDFAFGTEDGSWNAGLTARKTTPQSSSAAPGATRAQNGTQISSLSGTWKGSFVYNGNNVPQTFRFTSAGENLAGTVEGLPTTPAEIHDGKIDGQTISFWVNTDYQGETYKLVYTGKLDSKKIDFTLASEDRSWSTSFTADAVAQE